MRERRAGPVGPSPRREEGWCEELSVGKYEGGEGGLPDRPCGSVVGWSVIECVEVWGGARMNVWGPTHSPQSSSSPPLPASRSFLRQAASSSSSSAHPPPLPASSWSSRQAAIPTPSAAATPAAGEQQLKGLCTGEGELPPATSHPPPRCSSTCASIFAIAPNMAPHLPPHLSPHTCPPAPASSFAIAASVIMRIDCPALLMHASMSGGSEPCTQAEGEDEGG